jgi:ubiquinol-cytochrome c reductase iron-sulfur subunit
MANTAQPGPATADAHEGATRRDFIHIAASAVAGVGATIALWPLIDSMNPARDTLAAGAPVDVDISKLLPGQQIVVLWRSRPIFIMNRSADELKRLQGEADIEQLSDPNSRSLQQPPYAKNWHRSLKPEYLVLVGICTHLGCIPSAKPEVGSVGADWQGGYFCPCHGSKYDLAGRVFKGVPAPLNLPVPPYNFVSDKVIRIGENPPGAAFDLNSVEQL